MRIMIRGIPNFAHLQYREVREIEDIFQMFEVRARRVLLCDSIDGQFYDGKHRVSVYINPEEVSEEVLAAFCTDHKGRYVTQCGPSRNDPLRSGSAGSGRALPGCWQAVQADRAPNFPELKQELEAKLKAERLAREAEEAAEELRQEVLSDAVQEAIRRTSYDRVLSAIRDLS